MSGVKGKIVDLKRRSKFLTRLWYLSRQAKFKSAERKMQEKAKNRAEGYEDEKFISIKKIKGIHTGKRCFIVATGPSLTLKDLELLKDEYTFGMNSIPKLYDRTTWRPTYFGIQDCNVYRKMESIIQNVYGKADNVFVSDLIAQTFNVPSNYHQFPYDTVYHDNQLEIDRYFAEFSDDCYSIVYDGYSITYSLIQLAVYMGFEEIYLLGVDCSYKRGAKNHVVESGNDDKNEEKNHDKMVVGYQKAKEYADAHEIKIINCTRGGMLEVYPRMNLEDVLLQSKEKMYENSSNSTNEIE
ncbi:MAG: DUF115 domain-containing protein [Clostridiales bacterium]|nr:DUF115 domain-containing protein [Clostridiales bacterium]